jgi:hypothetical protein
MQARLIAYPPDGAATVHLIRAGRTLRIGRAREGKDDLVLDHASVSRAHADLRSNDDNWRLRDLDSKNGSFVDGIQIRDVQLPVTCWLRFGDVHCEFDIISDTEAATRIQRITARRAAATAHTARIERLAGLDDMLDASLRAVLELAQCERGFVLLEGAHGYAVRASLALDATMLATREFSGSVGAVRRAMGERRAVVVNDVGQQAWLSSRHSVVAAGLTALVCLPLLDGERVLGAIYADRVRAGAAISTLDLELLAAFTENAAVWIAARRTRELLDAHATPSPDWGPIVAAHTGESP